MWERDDPVQAAIGRAVERASPKRRAPPLSLIEFTRQAWHIIHPNEEWMDCFFHEENAQWGEALIRGVMEKQIHCGPSRSGKTTILVVMLQPWTWTFAPWMQFLSASHSYNLAEQYSTESRLIVESDWYQSRWPLELRKDQNRKGFFVNEEGGHRQIASVGGNTTGLGGHVIIGDDLLDAMDRYSPTRVREAVNYWRTSLVGRVNDPRSPKLLLMGQRLALQDPPGEIMKLGSYYHHITSQVYDQSILDKCPPGLPSKLPRLDPRSQDGELMWPERYNQEACDALRHELGPLMWAAAQQQWPVTEAGGVVAESHLRHWSLPDGSHNPSPARVISWLVPDAIQIHLDGRFKSTADSGSYVVIQVWARKGHNAYLVDMFRQRVGLPETMDALLRLIQDWRPALTVLELKASGQFILDALKEKIPGIVGYNPPDSKRARLEAKASHFRAGNVYLPEEFVYDWAGQVKAELVAFPFSANDDIPDMVSQALTHLFPMGQQQSYWELLKNI